MPKADVIGYEVDYVIFSGLGSVDELIEFATDHAYSLNLNVFKDPQTNVLNFSYFAIQPNTGGAPVEIYLGHYVVWDRNRFISIEQSEFNERFTGQGN